MSRITAILSWQYASPEVRSAEFRKFAAAQILSNRRHLADIGLYHGNIDLHGYEANGIDRFARAVIERDSDDDEAVDATFKMMTSISNAAKGAIPSGLLFHRACGERVRATLLKEAWVSGKSGSVLALNGGSRTRIASYFREVDQRHLMEQDEIDALASMKETVTIYRGAKLKDGSIRKTAFALSWTRDYKTARRFGLHGHGNTQGVVLRAEVPKTAVLALWETSGAEPEVVVDPRRVRSLSIAELIDPAEERAAYAA